jgi:hypothetical protein
MNYLLQITRPVVQSLAVIACLANSSSAASFYGDPPDTQHPWALHDDNRPQPIRVEPAVVVGGAPSDAVVLFDGSEASLANWFHIDPDDKRKGDWIVKEGALQCTPGAGYIASKEEFGDCQLHVEWLAPSEIKGNGQGRGNSGVFLMGTVEVQVLDNYNNPTYPDGTAGAVYGVMPPAANSLRGPGEWQSYDIIFRRPIVRDGVVLDAGSMTVLINGVVVQDSTPLEGGGGHKHRKPLDRVFPDKGTLRLQDHGNPVRYRNIWVRPLRPRSADGGTDGRISTAATMAKRAEIASDILAVAAENKGLARVLLLLESLIYQENDSARTEAVTFLEAYVGSINGMEAAAVEGEKSSLMNLNGVLGYMVNHGFMPNDDPTYLKVKAILDANGWSKKRP